MDIPGIGHLLVDYDVVNYGWAGKPRRTIKFVGVRGKTNLKDRPRILAHGYNIVILDKGHDYREYPGGKLRFNESCAALDIYLVYEVREVTRFCVSCGVHLSKGCEHQSM